MVERYLAKVDVVGSIPISRSNVYVTAGIQPGSFHFQAYSQRFCQSGKMAVTVVVSSAVKAASPSGKARVCKILILGSIPSAASKLSYLIPRLAGSVTAGQAKVSMVQK